MYIFILLLICVQSPKEHICVPPIMPLGFTWKYRRAPQVYASSCVVCRPNSEPQSIVSFICKCFDQVHIEPRSLQYIYSFVILLFPLCKSDIHVTLWLQMSRMKKEQSQKLEAISNTEAMRVTNKRQRVSSSNRLPSLVSLSWETHMDEGNSSVSIYFKVYGD